MTVVERLKWAALPTLIIISLGVLQIKFPEAMNGFDDGYTGRGLAGIIVLLFELFLVLTWSKTGGFVAIILGILILVLCFLPKQQEAKEEVKDLEPDPNKKQSYISALSSLAVDSSKRYLKRRTHNDRQS